MKSITFCLYFINCKSHIVSKSLNILLISRNEFMKRWIKISYSHWSAFKCLIHSLEICLLELADSLQCLFSLFNSIRKNHSSELRNSVLTKEHMLSSAKSDSFSSKFNSLSCICWCISISSYTKLSVLISKSHDSTEVSANLRLSCCHIALINLTCSTIKRNVISLVECISAKFKPLSFLINLNLTAS